MTDHFAESSALISERHISFSGRNLSSDTGAMLPLDFIQCNHLLDPYRNLSYSDNRSSYASHNSSHSLLTQLVFRYLCGYFPQADQEVLRKDPLLCRYFTGVSSQSSVSRFFSRITEETNNRFWKLFLDQACGFVDRNLDEILPDADSTKTDVYGKQEDAAWISHYRQIGYHPFVINEFNTRLLVGAWLRTGHTYSAAEAAAIMEEVLSRFSEQAPLGNDRTILFRGDSAFYQNELMELFEERTNPVLYAIRAKGTGSIENLCFENFCMNRDQENYTYTSSDPFYGEIRYEMSGSENIRRVCYKLYFTENEKERQKDRTNQTISLIPHIFAVITNIEEKTPEGIIEFYSERGASENFTKELKNDFGARTLSHRAFTANAFEFLLKCLAYNLFHMFQFLVMEGRDALITCSIFRKRYQKVASRMTSHAGIMNLQIASSFREKSKFLSWLKKARVKWNL